MSSAALGLCLTFVLSCISATFFLVLRCERKGRPFGPRSRWWAVLAVTLIGALAALGSGILAAVAHYAPIAIYVVAVLTPGGLTIDRIREDMPDRRKTAGAAATLWLGWLLARLDDAMAEDKRLWVEDRIDSEWHDDILLLAAHCYHDYLDERLPDRERRRHRIHAALSNIETRLDIARLIDSDVSHGKVVAAFEASRLRKDPRYRRNLDNLTRLGARMRHDAERETERLLAAAYGNGLYQLRRFQPAERTVRRHVAGPAGAWPGYP